MFSGDFVFKIFDMCLTLFLDAMFYVGILTFISLFISVTLILS